MLPVQHTSYWNYNTINIKNQEGGMYMKTQPIIWITRTAIFIALLIIGQLVTTTLGGNTIITGSIVNFILIISVMTCNLSTGLTVATVSPVFARLIGIGPLWVLIPFIVLGNIVLILIWNYIGNRDFRKKYVSYIVAMIVSSVCKFLVLYISIAKITIPYLLNLPDQQANMVSNIFSIPQLITALIGGVLAVNILPILKKAIKEQH